MKKVYKLFTVTLLALLFGGYFLSTPKIAMAAYTCSFGEIPNLDVIISPYNTSSGTLTFDKNQSIKVELVSLPNKFRGQNLDMYITNTSSQAAPFSIPVDSSGNATFNFTFAQYDPNLPTQGVHAIEFRSPTDSSGSPTACYSLGGISVTGQTTTCKNLGEACSPSDTLKPCGTYICNPQTGQVSVDNSKFGTFTYSCITKNPPTCQECENFSDGTHNCHPAPADKQTICNSTCNPTSNPITGGQTSDSGITCPNDPNAINTAIGCIPIDNQNDLIGFFLKWGIGIGGGIAFLLILVAGFQIMTSRGDPNRLKAGQELMTSAIAGLLLLIFSLIILKIIGLDILQIKGF